MEWAVADEQAAGSLPTAAATKILVARENLALVVGFSRVRSRDGS
jgi:hypothetical protein